MLRIPLFHESMTLITRSTKMFWQSCAFRAHFKYDAIIFPMSHLNFICIYRPFHCTSGWTVEILNWSGFHYSDVIMGVRAFQITSLMIVYSTVYSDADQRKHQSSAFLVFVRRIHRWPVNSPHKRPVTRKMVPFNHVIMLILLPIPLSVPRPS